MTREFIDAMTEQVELTEEAREKYQVHQMLLEGSEMNPFDDSDATSYVPQRDAEELVREYRDFENLVPDVVPTPTSARTIQRAGKTFTIGTRVRGTNPWHRPNKWWILDQDMADHYDRCGQWSAVEPFPEGLQGHWLHEQSFDEDPRQQAIAEANAPNRGERMKQIAFELTGIAGRLRPGPEANRLFDLAHEIDCLFTRAAK